MEIFKVLEVEFKVILGLFWNNEEDVESRLNIMDYRGVDLWGVVGLKFFVEA